MLRGLYAAANAMRYRAHEVDVTANNIANVSTDGFKRDRLAMRSFGDMLLARIEAEPEDTVRYENIPPLIGEMNLGGPAAESEFIDFSPGTPRTTGNPLDLYINGPGFFVIETPRGERYTRAGNFSLDDEGRIVNPSGQAVLGINNQPVRIFSSSPFRINQNGEIIQDGLPIGNLRIVEFADLSVIEKEGETLFRIADPTQPGPYPALQSSVEQGMIEGSNVNVVESLVHLIAAQRAYEAAARAVDMFNQSMTRVSGELGRLPG